MQIYQAIVSCLKCHSKASELILEAARLDGRVTSLLVSSRNELIERLLRDSEFRQKVVFDNLEVWAHKVAALRALEQSVDFCGVPAREIHEARADCRFCDYSSPIITNRLHLDKYDIPGLS